MRIAHKTLAHVYGLLLIALTSTSLCSPVAGASPSLNTAPTTASVTKHGNIAVHPQPTKASHNIKNLVIRQNAPAVITLPGSANDYIPSEPQPIPVSLEGPDFYVDSNDQGIDLYFTDELKAQLQDTIEVNCQDPANPRCQESVGTALQRPNIGLQSRFVGGGILIAAGVAAIAVLIESIHLGNAVPPAHIHFPPEVATTIKDQGDDGIPVVQLASITVSGLGYPASITVSALNVATTEASDPAQAGILISLPQELIDQANEILSDSQSICGGSLKRAVNLDCVRTGAQNLVGDRGGMHDLLLLPDVHGFVPRAQDLMRAANELAIFAVGFARTFRVPPETAAVFGVIAFAIAYEVIAQGQQLGPQMLFPSDRYDYNPDIVTSVIEGNFPSATAVGGSITSSQTSGCPNGLVCTSEYCSADTATKICQLDPWSGCGCKNEQSKTAPDEIDTNFWTLQFSFVYEQYTGIIQTPSCIIETATENFDGNPNVSPTAYCHCTQTLDPAHSLSWAAGQYSTIEGKSGPEQCAYTALPPDQISLVYATPTVQKGSPDNCNRIETFFTEVATDGTLVPTSVNTEFCTCNDYQTYDVSVMTKDSCVKTYCPDFNPDMPANIGGSCNGAPTDDPCSPCYIPPKKRSLAAFIKGI